MNTFLPEADFAESAAILDSLRLNKQIVETKQILDAINGAEAWAHHPIVTMWRNYVPALLYYGLTMAVEFDRRAGYQHKFQPLFEHQLLAADIVLPCWLCTLVTDSHKAALVYKRPAHYRRFYPDIPPALDYVWWHPEIGYYRGQLSQPETIRLIRQ